MKTLEGPVHKDVIDFTKFLTPLPLFHLKKLLRHQSNSTLHFSEQFPVWLMMSFKNANSQKWSVIFAIRLLNNWIEWIELLQKCFAICFASVPQEIDIKIRWSQIGNDVVISKDVFDIWVHSICVTFLAFYLKWFFKARLEKFRHDSCPDRH